MIIKIDRAELEAFRKVCAINDLDFVPYTMENNPLLMAVEITDKGNEITQVMALNIGRMVELEKDIIQMTDKKKEVERINDLP